MIKNRCADDLFNYCAREEPVNRERQESPNGTVSFRAGGSCHLNHLDCPDFIPWSEVPSELLVTS